MSSSSYFQDVREFHYKVLNVQDSKPHMLSSNLVCARINFMDEELNEFAEAERSGDIVGMADALADLVYVALGTAHMMGLPFDEIWDVVHGANMKKVRGMTKRGVECDAMKPEGWVGPEAQIAGIINAATKS